MEIPPVAGRQTAPRRRNWLLVAVGLLALTACVSTLGVLRGPVALAMVLAHTRGFGAHSVSSPPACPMAQASDAAPQDATGQFTIQPVYAEALTYAHDAAGQPKSQRVHLWSVDVLGQYPPMDDIFTSAVGGIDQWNAALSVIDPAAFRCVVQDMQSAHLAAWALTTLQAAAKEVSGPTTTVYLVPWYTSKFYGASGEQSLLIPFWEDDPLDRTQLRDASADWFYMPGALDHEYLEVARYDRLGSEANAYQTLLDNMVTDGLADNFAQHMTGAPREWAISPSEEAALWARFKPVMTQIANPDEVSQMLGDTSQDIPPAAGYAIGDHIVALYIQRHPNVTWKQLVGMDAQTIFAGSGYNG